jgi:hypothetical protein
MSSGTMPGSWCLPKDPRLCKATNYNWESTIWVISYLPNSFIPSWRRQLSQPQRTRFELSGLPQVLRTLLQYPRLIFPTWTIIMTKVSGANIPGAKREMSCMLLSMREELEARVSLAWLDECTLSILSIITDHFEQSLNPGNFVTNLQQSMPRMQLAVFVCFSLSC